MPALPLHHVWTYTDVDRAFWNAHLADWVPPRVFDAHIHLTDPVYRLHPVTDEMRRQYWVNEVYEPMPGRTAAHCNAIVFPGRAVTCLAFGTPSLAYDLDASNDYVRSECARRRWHSLALLRPEWPAARVAAELDKPGVIGVKPYYALIGFDDATRDRHLEASIFEFLPHHALEVLNDRRAWVTLHVPRAARLGHPQNIAEVRELRRRYPNLLLIIAHLGRSYTLPHAEEALPLLADDPGIYFDLSAVLNPAVLRLALAILGPARLLYGTDNPVLYMRGRQAWSGCTYINHTNYPFYFNMQREPPAVEATYTLYMYEALRALKTACEATGASSADVAAILHDNAHRLVTSIRKTR